MPKKKATKTNRGRKAPVVATAVKRAQRLANKLFDDLPPVKLKPKRKFIPLPTSSLARMKRPRLNHRIGVNLPLHLSDYKPVTTDSPKELLKTVKRNSIALLGVLTKLNEANNRSPLSVFTVTTSQLLGYTGEITPLLTAKNIGKIVQAAEFGLKNAFLLCRGSRLVWIHDMAITDAMLHLLRGMYHAMALDQYKTPTSLFKIILSRRELLRHYGGFARQPHTLLDQSVFQVQDDYSENAKARSEWLTYCIRNQQQAIFSLPISSLDTKVPWLVEEKKRLWLARSPLIIVHRQFKLTKANIDAECRYFLPLTRHSDVLIWRDR